MKKLTKRNILYVVLPIAVVVALIILWEVLVNALDVPRYILPAPNAIWAALLKYSDWLYSNMLYTLQQIMVGYAITIAVSIPLAVAVTYFSILDRTLYPIMVVLQLIPKVAIAPLFIVWFGFGNLPKVLMVFLLSFFPLVVNSILGFKSINHRLLYMARSITDSEFRTFWMIRLPWALPSIFAGLRISIAFAVVGAVVGEFVGSDRGLGYLLLRANGLMLTDLLFACLIVLSLLGIGLYLMITLLERIVMPWNVFKKELTKSGGAATM